MSISFSLVYCVLPKTTVRGQNLSFKETVFQRDEGARALANTARMISLSLSLSG